MIVGVHKREKRLPAGPAKCIDEFKYMNSSMNMPQFRAPSRVNSCGRWGLTRLVKLSGLTRNAIIVKALQKHLNASFTFSSLLFILPHADPPQ
jgi:hypothetical protein